MVAEAKLADVTVSPEPNGAVRASFLELAVMEPLEAGISVQVVKMAHPNWHVLGPEAYDRECLPDYTVALMSHPPIVGKLSGRIVAVYEIPEFFRREKGLIAFGRTVNVGALGSVNYSDGSSDWFAVAQGEQGKGLGRAFFNAFAKLVEHVASEVEVPVVHRVTAIHRSKGFFEKCGYRSVWEEVGLREDVCIMERVYFPKKQGLMACERKAAGHLLSVMNGQLTVSR